MKITIYKDTTIVAYEKAIKVINSCESINQLQIAKKYCELFFKRLFPMLKLFPQGSSYVIYYDLQEKLIRKEKELL